MGVTNPVASSPGPSPVTTTMTSSSSNWYRNCRCDHRTSYQFRPQTNWLRRGLICVVLAANLIGAKATATSKGGEIEVEVRMPREAELGSSIDLNCEWRLRGGGVLYSVKWYKDDHEFFRYVPDNDPRIQTFQQPGINLDKRSSNERSIKLRKLELASSGQYKCEVSTEAPSFATIYRAANLTIIALPQRGPEITGLSSHYAVGENVTANCTSWPSYPRARLRWSINGDPVPAEKTIKYPALSTAIPHGLPNSLGLRLEVEPRHLDTGTSRSRPRPIRIKCTALVGTRVYETTKEIPMAYVNNERLSAGDTRARAIRVATAFVAWPLIVLLVVALAT